MKVPNSFRKLVQIQIITIITFILVKFFIRPIVLEGKYPHILEIFVLSYPNFCEAIVGSIAILYLIYLFEQGFRKNKESILIKTHYAFPVGLAGIYVILQELKIHNLGGENTYDPYDILFSILGLITSWLLIKNCTIQASNPKSKIQ